jgi:hypothetical protein
MDRGFSKLKISVSKSLKILIIAAVLGSEHPIVPSRAPREVEETL